MFQEIDTLSWSHYGWWHIVNIFAVIRAAAYSGHIQCCRLSGTCRCHRYYHHHRQYSISSTLSSSSSSSSSSSQLPSWILPHIPCCCCVCVKNKQTSQQITPSERKKKQTIKLSTLCFYRHCCPTPSFMTVCCIFQKMTLINCRYAGFVWENRFWESFQE